MSDNTRIQWTDATWNPVSGCSKVSAGCKNCYAEHDWNRLSKDPKSPYFGRAFTDVEVHPERLNQPLRWEKPRKIFVNSMSDLFHEDVSDYFIASVFDTMEHEHAQHHTFQILTKRSERMRQLTTLWAEARALSENIWLGVSVENREQYGRINQLHHTPAAVKFLSLEPLLEAMPDLPLMDYPSRIGWVIVGGESGPNARPCNIEWIRQIIAQCHVARVPIFCKQIGSVLAREIGSFDRKGGTMEDWPLDIQCREFPR